MKHNANRILLVAIALMTPLAAHAGNYTWTGGGPEGTASSLVVAPWNPDTLYSVAWRNGLFRSDDRGANWSLVEGLRGFEYLQQVIFTSGSSPVMLVGSPRGVYRSVDQGITWSFVPIQGVGDLSVSLAARGDTVWALDFDGSLHQSLDAGASWIPRAQLTEPGTSVAIDPTTGRVQVSAGSGHTWSDDGDTWNSTSHPTSRVVKTVPGQPGVVWTAGFYGVHRSIDGGQTFQPMNDGLANYEIIEIAIPSVPGLPYLAGSYYNGLFRSEDGSSWVPVPIVDPRLRHAAGSTLALPGSSPRILTTVSVVDEPIDNWLAISDDLGETWPLRASGLLGDESIRVAIHPDNPETVWTLSGAFFGVGARLYRSDDRGETWRMQLEASLRTLAVHPGNPEILYVGGVDTGVWRSNDGGDTWDRRGEADVCCITNFALHPGDPNTLYVSTENFDTFEVSVRKSTDGGETWIPLVARGARVLLIDPADPETIYTGGDNFVFDLFRSEDGGQTWSSLGEFHGLQHGAIDPTDPMKIYLSVDSGVQVSNDGGQQWQHFPYPEIPFGQYGFKLDPLNPSHLYLGEGTLGPGRIFRSTDAGRTWNTTITTGPFTRITSIDVRGRDLWMSSDAGTYHLERLFLDVPAQVGIYPFVDATAMTGVTAGCGAGAYCPTASVTRAQTSVFLLRSHEGIEYLPPPSTGAVFADVPADAFAAAWIEELSDRGITGGCAPMLFCPDADVTRAQAAVLNLRTKNGDTYQPPPATGTMFADVPVSHYAAAWIEEFARQGYTAGCAPSLYCPDQAVTRGQMAVFLAAVFALL
jgi:photosystem II stability/assembly factor-like uncharacterized protein